jgi:hypothetical protein
MIRPIFVVMVCVWCSHEEQVRVREKRCERYRELLADYYYRSDHVGIEWREAKEDLER